jgi:hypothetical protein
MGGFPPWISSTLGKPIEPTMRATQELGRFLIDSTGI